MKKIVMLMAICLVLVTGIECIAENKESGMKKNENKEIRKGDSVFVQDDWEWVKVKNPDPIESGNNEFVFNDACGIEQGGELTVIAVEGDKALVKYTIDDKKYGTPCPSGVIFFIAKEKFLKMRQVQETLGIKKGYFKEKLEEEKNRIRKLMGK